MQAMPTLALDVVKSGERLIQLNLNEGQFLRLDQPAKAIFLSNPAIAEVDLQSSRHIYLVARAIGQTSLFILGDDDETVFSANLKVGVDVKRLTQAVQRAISNGTIAIETIDGVIFLKGHVRTQEDAVTAETVLTALTGESGLIVNKLELEAQSQVNLQVRIAEVSRSISEDLGISLSASNAAGTRQLRPPPPSIDNGFQIQIGSGSRKINLVLDALARSGLVTILSEPNLTAHSGEKASFLAGGRVPYPSTNQDGEVSYTLEAIGVELEFTPTVRDHDQIRIEIDTRVRDIDRANSANPEVPALTERGATTTVELGSGQSFAIAGMFRSNANQSVSGLPALSNLPIIGALFRSSRFARGETELVIIVTPWVVAPVSPRDLKSPIDTLSPAQSGLEQALTGRTDRHVRFPNSQSPRFRKGGFLLQ